MYGKIFESIYDGTLASDWRALITFQQFIILCDADGMVDMTHDAISRRTGIPIEHITKGIKILEKVDPSSRTPDEEGRRIELIDEHREWGWHIVNHKKYRDLQDATTIREQTKERVRKHRAAKKSNVTVTSGNASNAVKRYTDTNTDTDTNTQDQKRGNKRFSPPSLSEVKTYCSERQNNIDPENFINFYEAKGWMIGKNKMKNWKACITTWEKRDTKKPGETNGRQTATARVSGNLERLFNEQP